MADSGTHHRSDALLRRLTRTRLSVRLAMLVERLWPLVLPVLVTISLFVSLSWLGVFRVLPDWARYVVLTVFALAAIASFIPFRRFRAPSNTEIDRRIEAANQLRHAPVLTQSDRLTPSSQDPFAQALWREHQKRMADKLGRLSGDLPYSRIPERDPWALRAVAPLLLFIAFAFSAGPLGGSLTNAFRSHAGTERVPVRIDAWVTPPAYTGKAPLFLSAQQTGDDAPVFPVPTGSVVAVRVAGGTGAETLNWLDAHSGTETVIEFDRNAFAAIFRHTVKRRHTDPWRRGNGTPALGLYDHSRYPACDSLHGRTQARGEWRAGTDL
jgi:uncharacterized protein (TIGR02302 family)